MRSSQRFKIPRLHRVTPVPDPMWHFTHVGVAACIIPPPWHRPWRVAYSFAAMRGCRGQYGVVE